MSPVYRTFSDDPSWNSQNLLKKHMYMPVRYRIPFSCPLFAQVIHSHVIQAHEKPRNAYAFKEAQRASLRKSHVPQSCYQFRIRTGVTRHAATRPKRSRQRAPWTWCFARTQEPPWWRRAWCVVKEWPPPRSSVVERIPHTQCLHV